ncbi:SRPBCC family protein [Solitalea canadensis]|uniref:Polyketide cyclase / dehydrase and lipid transport n=1 Tax=Solitalea canadensis (strain ATCC 29591 / DSM 3403 / JCM 21819 / LMG 8368 / NBRC 15130 / NCIMB 12057 / USAM 9D) TaxID=929556 RepID=H8KXK4_SOLCM|nr:SRPBCC family protein [Solitalea canadensis]AFD05300.1 hypothetical protein Solca_0146 [Solitalea canadensis DSM 3403]
MNTVSIIALIIVLLAIIFLLAALIAPKGYSFKREITINKPVQLVFDYLRHLKNQDQFNKWVMMDPHLKKSFRGNDGEVGFVYAWEGNKQAGVGEQEIIRIENNRKIEVEVRFDKPMKGVAYTPFTTMPISNNETKVTWGMSSKMNYPLNIILLFMNMDKMLGKDVEGSLELLKQNLEHQN